MSAAIIPLQGSGTADASGNITITFAPVPPTVDYTGSVSIPTAPATAESTVQVQGYSLGGLNGNGTYGPFTVLAGQQLSVVGSGFTPDKQYQGTFSGSAAPAGQGPIVTATSNPTVTQITGPVTIDSITGSVTVNGSVTAEQGQVVLGNVTGANNLAPTQRLHYSFPIPAGIHINAVAFKSIASGSFGAIVFITGGTTTDTYWVGRPNANEPSPIALYDAAPTLDFIVPFPGDVEGSVNVTVWNPSTTVTQGIQEASLVGFEGTVPALNPPPVVTSLATGTALNGATPTVLAALTDSRQYRLWSIDAVAFNSGTSALMGFVNTGPVAICQVPSINSVPNTKSISFPAGVVIGPGPVTLQAGYDGIHSASYIATITYDYA